MSSIQQRKAIMAAVLIHYEAREILSIPNSVKTYADFQLWTMEDGKEVPKGLQKQFTAIFEKHYEEYVAVSVDELGHYPVTAGQGQLVDAFGYPVNGQLMAMPPGQRAGPQSHDDPPAARARALGHRRTGARDLGQGYPVGARSTRGVESDRATESFTRQITALRSAREKEDSMEVAARAAKQAMGDNSECFQANKKQEEDEEEEL